MSLASATASASVLKRITLITGPKISSRAIVMPLATPSNTVGST